MLAELLSRHRAARPELKTVFENHKDRVFTVALVCLEGDRAAAEDAAQEVFVRLAGRLWQFRGEARLTTWLHRVTVNICRDELRRRRRSEKQLPDPEPPPTDSFIARRELHEAIESLPETLRTPILLRYFHELSYDEIATQLGCPTGTVATRLHRGLKQLAKRLGEEETEP
ncbi:RNA polymerase sigma factor [Armatimonas sp.]|uniref:RNA polymerase sigma factor n=1 Tax=Armatimonas sp. TaxID=1872638 RepID=UPI00286C1520|nr:RNA polymerase sigma factor [Armatimonas sp.]